MLRTKHSTVHIHYCSCLYFDEKKNLVYQQKVFHTNEIFVCLLTCQYGVEIKSSAHVRE